MQCTCVRVDDDVTGPSVLVSISLLQCFYSTIFEYLLGVYVLHYCKLFCVFLVPRVVTEEVKVRKVVIKGTDNRFRKENTKNKEA